MIEFEMKESFEINQILECGQCFRYKEIRPMVYEIIAYGRRLLIEQEGSLVRMNCSEETYESLWKHYFDMDRDYSALMTFLKEKDHYLKEAVESKSGLRVLKQEPFEMLMTFIISQNKSMPQIKILVERLCTSYGEKKEDDLGIYYAFPRPEELRHVSEEAYRDLKVGFRAPYLLDAVKCVLDGSLNLEELYLLEKEEARPKLIQVKGIGGKVADCILLFAYGKADVFPIDVWVRRIMTENYFEGEKTSDQKILAFADDYYGGVSGLAQQYLFYHGRDSALKDK